MTFALYPLRFYFVAQESIRFPPDKAANVLRGAFGTMFRRLACVPECEAARRCELRRECAYARIFEPGSLEAAPSGFIDWPRPFVFRAWHLNGVTLEPGQRFHFDVNLFELTDTTIAYFALAFAQLAIEGIGPGRGRAVLESVWQLHKNRKPKTEVRDGPGERPLVISFSRVGRPVRAVRIEFVTPTELKDGNEIVLRPEFPALFRRVRDRVGLLSSYCGDLAELDFAAIGQRSTLVEMTRCDVRHIRVTRTSTRTGQSHPLGGIVGSAEYHGDLTEFIPFLEAAQWTGVGRHTVWGNGEIRVHVMREY